MQGRIAPGMRLGPASLLVSVGGKLVLEVLPAALASLIGAFLFAQYQFNHAAPAAPAVTPAVAPASAEMLQLVREEHTMIRDFLTAQRTAELNRAVAANAADAQATAAPAAGDTTLTAALPQQITPPSGMKAAAPRARIIVAASRAPKYFPAALPPIVIAGARPTTAALPVTVANIEANATAPITAPSVSAQPEAGLWPAPPSPARPSIVADTLAVPGHVVSVTLHAVMAIGGIPSWFGHRFDDDDTGAAALPSSSAS